MAVLFEPVSDPAPYPATAKSPADKDKGLSRRLRAGGTDRPWGRCCRETAGCSTAQDATAGNSTIRNDKIPMV